MFYMIKRNELLYLLDLAKTLKDNEQKAIIKRVLEQFEHEHEHELEEVQSQMKLLQEQKELIDYVKKELA